MEEGTLGECSPKQLLNFSLTTFKKYLGRLLSTLFFKVLTSCQNGDIGKQACLLAQPQQKLQLHYKTTITQNHQKIKLYRSPITKELKKSHSFRRVGGVETGNKQSIPLVMDKNQEGYHGSEGSQSQTRPPSPVPVPGR